MGFKGGLSSSRNEITKMPRETFSHAVANITALSDHTHYTTHLSRHTVLATPTNHTPWTHGISRGSGTREEPVHGRREVVPTGQKRLLSLLSREPHVKQLLEMLGVDSGGLRGGRGGRLRILVPLGGRLARGRGRGGAGGCSRVRGRSAGRGRGGGRGSGWVSRGGWWRGRGLEGSVFIELCLNDLHTLEPLASRHTHRRGTN